MGWSQWLQQLLRTRTVRGPRREDPLAEFREVLFADESLESAARFAATRGTLHGKNAAWGFFARAADRLREGQRPLALQELRGVLAQHGDDARFRLLAWHCLRQLGEHPDREESARILGIVIESEGPLGPDILSVYADGTARHLRSGGGYLLFEDPSPEMRETLQRFLQTGQAVVATRKPIKGPRPAPPSGSEHRVSVLTPAGARIHQGRWAALKRDARTGPILYAVEALLHRLSEEADGPGANLEPVFAPLPPPTDGTPIH